MTKLSVVISAYNAELKIKETLSAVSDFADEIIFINNSSTDNTREIAAKYTKKIFDRPNNPMLNVNKNFGFDQAQGEWILNLDHDEVITPELKAEILSTISSKESMTGYFIPRKNIIFGKWIAHTGWYPDYQLRLFRRGKGRFEEKHVHEFLKLEGEIGHLENPMIHYNYETITQFLLKMTNIYTPSEAENLIKSGYRFKPYDVIRMPFQEFLSRFFARQGYRDGLHGLAISLLMAFYHLIVFMRVWEFEKYKDPDVDSLHLLVDESKKTGKELRHWVVASQNEQEKSAIKKYIRKARNRIKL